MSSLTGERRFGFLLGLFIPVTLVAGLLLVSREARTGQPVSGARAPTVDVYRDGPLGGGRKVSLEDARADLGRGFPFPETNEITGELAGIWITSPLPEKVGAVWRSGLRFYVAFAEASEASLVKSWGEKVATDPEAGRSLVLVRGHTGIGHDGGDIPEDPAGLTWVEQGLILRIVWENHSLSEVVALANEMSY